jgi:integrating conjugative element protein (TIGR03756 family)
MNSVRIFLLLIIIAVCFPSQAQKKITMLDIANDSMKAAINNPTGNFLHWKLTGVCIWLHMGFPPYISKTFQVEHFLPDAIISVFNRNGEDVIYSVDKGIDPIAKSIGDSADKAVTGYKPEAGDNGSSAKNDAEMKFKEVDVIGNPASQSVSSIFSDMMIGTTISSYNIYYSSMLDSIAWRTPTFDLLINLFNDGISIGEVNQWGSLYPRNGYINQPGDFKAAAVLALRAADISAATGGLHIYQPFNNGCGDSCSVEPSTDSDINNNSVVEYQEIYPEETDTESNVIGSASEKPGTINQDQIYKSNGNYVWIMWRHYHGCIQGGGELIAIISSE